MPILVGVALSACNDEGDAIEGVGGSGAKAGSTGSGGDDAKAGSSNNGGKAGSETNTDGGTEDPGNGGTTNNAGTSSGGSGNEAGEGGDAGMAGMGGDGGGGEPPIVNGGTGGSSAGTGGTGGSSAGTGGTGGSSAGTGGSSAGTGGSSAGTGGTDAGGGGSGGSGGSGPCVEAAHTIRNFATDPGGALDKYLTPDSGTLHDSVLSWDAVEGNPCAGSAKLVAKFSGAFGEKAQISNYGAPFDLTGKTKVHAMVKLVSATNLTHISKISFSMNSNGYANYTGTEISTSGYVSGTWYQIDLDFATAFNAPSTGPVLSAVNNIAVQMVTVDSGTTPVETTMYVDEIWVE